jgi:tetratricopeptide (TPR) repeat protein
MMKNFYNHIDDYLNGSLSGNELKVFEAELKVNPELRKQLAFNREVNSTIIETDIDELKIKLNQAQKQQHKQVAKRRLFITSIAAAAAIALIVSIGSLFLNSQISPTQIFADSFEAYQPIGQTRDLSDNKQSENFLLIHKLYSQKEFAKAIPLLEAALEQETSSAQAHLMLSSAYLSSSQPAKAEALLKNLLNTEMSFQHKEIAKWYLALSLTKQGKTSEARTLFNEIANEHGFYAKEASDILALFDKL